MIGLSERTNVSAWIGEACADGARLSRACEVLEISPRTLQRWRGHGAVRADGRKQTKVGSEPANKLSEHERQQILDVANTSEFAHLPPSQIVLALADQGRYIASESSFYRVLREVSQLAHRGKAKPASRQHPKPLQADAPNQLWSWDITYCAPSLRKLLWKMLSGLEHVWNASRIILEEMDWMPALYYGRA